MVLPWKEVFSSVARAESCIKQKEVAKMKA